MHTSTVGGASCARPSRRPGQHLPRRYGLAALLAVSALLLCLVPVASAAPLGSVEGAPTIDASSATGYYIFHDENGFHLRTHGPGAQHDFDAALHSKGTFENVDVVKLESGDKVDVTDGGHRMVIHFRTFDATDGVNFTVNGGDKLHLALKLDGRPAKTDEIFLGGQGKHPKHNPFTIKF